MNFRIDYTEAGKRKRNKIDLTGKTVCITGALPGMNRSEATLWVMKRKKANFNPNIDRTVDYLIVGKSRSARKSSKITNAEKLQIPRIEYSDIA